MADAPVGQRAASLPWLAPAGRSLLALTDAVPDDRVLGRDPAMVALALRFTRPSPTADCIRLDSSLFSPSLVAEAAARLVEVDRWQDRPQSDMTASLVGYANTLRDAAPSPAVAVSAFLSSLGWLAVSAVDPDTAEDCLSAIHGGEPADSAQLRLWGMTHDAIARRLVRRWKFPDWAASAVGNLSLPDVIETPDTIRTAVRVVIRSAGDPLGLIGPPSGELPTVAPSRTGEPLTPNLLVRLLRAVARERRAARVEEAERSAREFDALAVAVRAMAEAAPARLHDAKLAAVAELAAGAGHEINNPLAVISGNAQLLLSHEEDDERRATLATIVRHSRRLADIVADLMQFARPRPPVRRSFAVGEWLAAAVEPYRAIASVKGVRLDVNTRCDGTVHADPDQLAKAVGELLRNAVEVTPSGGIVSVRIVADSVVIEDDGPGPDPDMLDHLFDPFYSGKSAGRGRGLGLSIAWRLATQNGATVRYEPIAGATRFVLQLPVEQPTILAADRMSA